MNNTNKMPPEAEVSQHQEPVSPNEIGLELGQAEVPQVQSLEEASEVEQLKRELAEAEKRVLLAQAELENFRRRIRRDMQDQLKYASLPLIGEILEAVDNLGRAIEAHQPDANSESLFHGMKMVLNQISQSLQNHGCKKIESVGQPFDRNLHQAVQIQPKDDVPANTVLADLRAGFMLHDRVIRPSQVAVSAGTKA